MLVYNTLSRKKEVFKSIEPGFIKMYVCGPTVYDYMHIGNARPNVIFDVIRRYFEYKGYVVTYVQNFTDVDDKIIKRANEQSVAPSVISERYIEEAHKDALGLGIKEATKNPKVTEEMETIIELINVLVKKGYAYEVNGSVYYETRKFPDYGKLSKKNPDDLEAGARIEVNSEKRNPMDFVLWKPKKDGEPEWESPWSKGRPGWHIECSAMAKRYLGDTIDIHAGGSDLTFPHHENEIAQSEAANGEKFANYWMHNGFINIDNKKMSKSEGKFFTVREIVELFDYQVARFFIVSAHYRSPINFSQDLMEAAQSSLNRIKSGASDLRYSIEHAKIETMFLSEKELVKNVLFYKDNFEKAMEDDFNTADAVTAIFELIKFSNTHGSSDSSIEFLTIIQDQLEILCDILGIVIKEEKILLDEEIEELIRQRQQARKDKDFALADSIREQLTMKGIVIEDTREGVRFKRI